MELRGKKVLVVGLARTGLATAAFLKDRGAFVSATEMKGREEIGRDALREVEAMGVETEWGSHREGTFLDKDLIVVSPGVDLAIEPIQKAKEKGIPVVSEIELACRFIQVPMIAVTGTNGKTTTTLLLGEMLKEDGRKVGIGGNVGEPLILFAGEKQILEVLVVEVSSFQLEAIETFRPRVSLLLNITEDHLDRYPNYAAYIEAKSRIFVNQGPEDQAVLNGNDPVVLKLAGSLRPQKSFFGLKKSKNQTAYYNPPCIVLSVGGSEEWYSLERAPLKGVHNVENMMAAVTAARLVGCSQSAIRGVIDRFQAPPHRLEFVRELDGVRYYNDSKGTNVGSVVRSLESFSEPIVLIAGGKDKEGDLGPLKAPIQDRVRGLILIGAAKERMAKELGPLTETTVAKTLEEAVLLAHQMARKGEIVLLSPACSSYDMFRDYKERGKAFKDAIWALRSGC